MMDSGGGREGMHLSLEFALLMSRSDIHVFALREYFTKALMPLDREPHKQMQVGWSHLKSRFAAEHGHSVSNQFQALALTSEAHSYRLETDGHRPVVPKRAARGASSVAVLFAAPGGERSQIHGPCVEGRAAIAQHNDGEENYMQGMQDGDFTALSSLHGLWSVERGLLRRCLVRDAGGQTERL